VFFFFLLHAQRGTCERKQGRVVGGGGCGGARVAALRLPIHQRFSALGDLTAGRIDVIIVNDRQVRVYVGGALLAIAVPVWWKKNRGH